MISGFGSSLSALQVTSARHDITAHDVANVNTAGFSQSTPYQASVSPEGVRISHISRQPNETGISNTDLAEEAKEQIVNKDTYTANLKMIKVKDRMVGELLDLLA